MDPSEFAAEELEQWQQALSNLHEAERRAEAARREDDPARFVELLNLVDKLRIRADLLLAEAMELKCSYRASQWAQLKLP